MWMARWMRGSLCVRAKALNGMFAFEEAVDLVRVCEGDIVCWYWADG